MSLPQAQIPHWQRLDLDCPFCGKGFAWFSELAEHVANRHPGGTKDYFTSNRLPQAARWRESMGKTLGQIKEERGIGGPPLLQGSHVKGQSVKIKVEALREAPANFGSPAIIDFAEEVHDKEGWAVNITNLRALAELAGFNDPDEADFDKIAAWAKGKTLTLHVALVNNPKSKKMVRSLFLQPPE